MVVKNIQLIEQHLQKEGFGEVQATPHEWFKYFGKDVCRIDLNGETIVSTWNPLEDYSDVSVDFSTRPMMEQVFLDIESLYETGEILPLIGRAVPAGASKPVEDKPDTQPNEVIESAPVKESTIPSKPPRATKPPMPVPSIHPNVKDQEEQNSNSGPPVPHQKSILDADQIDAGKSTTNPSPAVPASPPIDEGPQEEVPKKLPELPFNAKDVMNKTQGTVRQEKTSSHKAPIPTPKPEIQNPPALVDAAKLDKQMAEQATAKWLQNRGTSYTVHDQTRPDAAGIQGAANRNNVSTEILKAVQTKDFAEVIVRTHYKGQYVDTVVHNDFENSKHILMIEMAVKHPEIVDSFSSEGYPIFIPGATISDKSGKIKNAMTTIIHTLLSDIQFSIRDCTTKAASAGHAKILNRDWRDDNEIESEQHERALVSQLKKDRV